MKTKSNSVDMQKKIVDLLAHIAIGEKAILDGKTFSSKQARKKMQRWLK